MSPADSISEKESEEEERVCPHCNSPHLDSEGGQLVCMNCGAVIEDNVVSSEQERFYSYEDAIKKGKHSFASQNMPKTKTDQRNLSLARTLINELINKLHLPYFVREEAIKLYRNVMIRETLRKDTVPAIAAALVYLVCRKSRISIPLERVAEESETSKSDLMKSYMEIIEVLKIDVPPPSVEGLAILFAKKANLKANTVVLARKIAKRLKNDFVNIGKDPNGIAAAAVYAAAKRNEEDATQKEIAKIASITEVTIRNRFMEVKKAIRGLDL